MDKINEKLKKELLNFEVDGYVIVDKKVEPYEILRKYGKLKFKIELSSGKKMNISQLEMFETEDQAKKIINMINDKNYNKVYNIDADNIDIKTLTTEDNQAFLIYFKSNGRLGKQKIKMNYVKKNFENCNFVFLKLEDAEVEFKKHIEKKNELRRIREEKEEVLKAKRVKRELEELEARKIFKLFEEEELWQQVKTEFIQKREEIDYTSIVKERLFDNLYNRKLYDGYRYNLKEYNNEDLEEYLKENDVDEWLDLQCVYDIYCGHDSTIGSEINEDVWQYETDILVNIIKSKIGDNYSDEAISYTVNDLFNGIIEETKSDVENWINFSYDSLKNEIDYKKIKNR